MEHTRYTEGRSSAASDEYQRQGVACASSNEKDAWALKKERDPGRGREKAKQEKN